MSSREKLIEILSCKVHPRDGIDPAVVVADYLLDNDEERSFTGVHA